VTAPHLSPGAIVAGKYRIHALLGHGGSSASYQAASAEAQVVLKLLSPQLAQRPDMVQALQQFHAGTNSLPTELVVPIVDAGFDATSNAPFSATELMRVPSLAQIVAQRPMAAEDVARFMAGLARAVDAAHVRQMAHHALKPNNVFVAGPPYDAVRVMDFGASLVRSVVPTQEGYEGSAPWMAPEQAQATAPAGPSADIFASALLAFYAMTGRSFWLSCQGARPDVAGWQREIAAMPPPVSSRAREVGFPLSPALDLAFARALSPNPAERYRTLGEFAAALASASPARAGSEATMAFPASAFEPPPGAGAKPDTGYPPPPAPMGAVQAQPAMQQQAMQPQAMQQQAMPPGSPMQQTQVALPASPKSGKAATIFVAIAAVVLVGGAVTAFLVARSKPADAGPIAVEATTAAAAAGSGETIPAAAADPPSAAPTGEAAAPTASAAASAEPAADAEVSVKLTCDPACGALEIDGKAATDPTAELHLAPGTHKITVTKDGYLAQTETITVVAGTPFEKEYKLAPKPAAPVAGPRPAVAKKPCGKFLKRCD
jgi:hypothetical protein